MPQAAVANGPWRSRRTLDGGSDRRDGRHHGWNGLSIGPWDLGGRAGRAQTAADGGNSAPKIPLRRELFLSSPDYRPRPPPLLENSSARPSRSWRQVTGGGPSAPVPIFPPAHPARPRAHRSLAIVSYRNDPPGPPKACGPLRSASCPRGAAGSSGWLPIRKPRGSSGMDAEQGALIGARRLSSANDPPVSAAVSFRSAGTPALHALKTMAHGSRGCA
jgi:hypothetical protein